jgi:hypothetical protein
MPLEDKQPQESGESEYESFEESYEEDAHDDLQVQDASASGKRPTSGPSLEGARESAKSNPVDEDGVKMGKPISFILSKRTETETMRNQESIAP